MTVSAIICAFGRQPYLRDCVDALLASKDVDVEVIVVDNGSSACRDLPDEVTLISPGRNTGFAMGCNLGAQAASGQTLVFVNSDAVVDPDCLVRLERGVNEPGAGLVGATIVLADEPDTVNSWGNPVHLLGFSWAGGYGQPAALAATGERASVSGAVFAVSRDVFLGLGGMDPEYFTYGEDVDLSLRAWLRGLSVRVLSEAVASHHYDFSRNPDKLYLLERNRLITITTTYRVRTLAGLFPLLLASEVSVLARSARQGWLREKVRGWGWLVGHGRYLRSRRHQVQRSRRLGDASLMEKLSTSLEVPERFDQSVSAGVQKAAERYWASVGSRVAGL